jgi:hypothetical protein
MNTCDGSFFDVIAVRNFQVFKAKGIIACYEFFTFLYDYYRFRNTDLE